MRIIKVEKNEAGQRLDKLLAKILKEAPGSFLYKMLRKKNITLNGKKATGKEKVCLGDEIKFFLSEETFEKFAGTEKQQDKWKRMEESIKKSVEKEKQQIKIVYEDDDILIFDKPAGMLSQKAEAGDLSAGEYLLYYLLESGAVSCEQFHTFVPAVCNRLDRNTSGLLLAGKTLAGSQFLSEMIKKRDVRKFYRCIVDGEMKENGKLKGYLFKDEKTNRVIVSEKEIPNTKLIETVYEPVGIKNHLTMLEVELITGRTHQIRAHLASIGHPVLGDPKYGNKRINRKYFEKNGISRQLLHSYRIEFPEITGKFSYLSGKKIQGTLPADFELFSSAIAYHSGESCLHE